MNTSQWVNPLRPDRCPNNGSIGVRFNTSRTFTCVSFHLKTKTPSVANTRKHSSNPFCKSSFQLSDSFPYFAANQLFFPAFTRCGGSNATSLNEPSAYGRFLKSSNVSGSIFNSRVPDALPCDRSVSSIFSSLQSPKMTLGFLRSSHIIRDPQHGSRIFFSDELALLCPSENKGTSWLAGSI